MVILPKKPSIGLMGMIGLLGLVSASPVLAAFPSSNNYRLNEWSIGGGGTDRSQSANYMTQVITDPTVGEAAKSTNYAVNPGLLFVDMANVPPAPDFRNQSDHYDRLHLTLNTGNNPSNTTYAVAISSDNFVTTYYVKADNTIGATLTASDWRTYASFGGADGTNVLGLAPNTTYQVKVKAERGDFTESGWGPMASATTSPPKLTFDIDVAATDQETASPHSVDLGQLEAGVVTTATDKIWVDFETNANNGGVVFVGGTNGGLKSATSNVTIPAVSADLSTEDQGFGIRNDSITQTSGGPFTADAPFNGAGDTVGSTGTTLIPLQTSLTPIVGGRSSQEVKAVVDAVTPGSTDYTETITIIAAGTF